MKPKKRSREFMAHVSEWFDGLWRLDRRRARPARARAKPTSRLALMLLACIALYALAYCVVYVGGPSFYGDDTTYLSLANQVLTGSYIENSYIFSIRPMQIFPIALSYWLFGVSMLSSSAWDIVAFLGSIIIAFHLGKELHGELAGLLSSLLLAFFPLVVILAPTISDDITMMFTTSLAMLAMLYGYRRSSRAWYLVSGYAIVASPLITPEGLVVIIIAFAYLLAQILRGRMAIDKTSVYLLYGVLMAGLMAMIFNYLYSGDPLITYTVSSHFYGAVGVKTAQNTYATIPSTNEDPWFYPDAMFPYGLASAFYTSMKEGNFNVISVFWTRITAPSYDQVGLFFYAAGIAAAYLLYRGALRKDWRPAFAMYWLLAGFLYLEFGPMHVSLFPFQYLLSYRLARFLTFIAVPAVAVIGIALATVLEGKGAPKWWAGAMIMIAVVVLLVFTSERINYFWYQILYLERYDQLAIAGYMNALPNTTPLYFASGFSNLPIYMRFNNTARMQAYDQIKDCHSIPAGAYVVIPAYEEVFGLNYTPNPQMECRSWKLVMQPRDFSGTYPQTITITATSFRASLYYVPLNATGT